MASYSRSTTMGVPRDFTDHGPCVEDLAAEFAKQDAQASEKLIESLVTQAIRQWRLDDATFWQRVKFQARLIRATGPRPTTTTTATTATTAAAAGDAHRHG